MTYAGSLSAGANDSEGWRKEEMDWRAKHVADLQKPDGWLSLAGLDWLDEGENCFGAAADNKIRLSGARAEHLGALELRGSTVRLVAPANGFPNGFLVSGVAAQEQVLRTDADNDKHAPHLTIGTLNMYVIRRADRFALRVKDSRSQALLEFHGLKWYAPDQHYRVTAKWDTLPPGKNDHSAYADRDKLYAADTGRGGIHIGRGDFPVGGGVRRGSRPAVFYFAGCYQHFHDVWGLPVSLYFPAEPRAGAAWGTDAGLQPPGESPLRVHAVCDLPAAAAG